MVSVFDVDDLAGRGNVAGDRMMIDFHRRLPKRDIDRVVLRKFKAQALGFARILDFLARQRRGGKAARAVRFRRQRGGMLGTLRLVFFFCCFNQV